MSTDTTASPISDFHAEWQRWRRRRLEALHAADGPATLVSTTWLDETDTVDGIPGRWIERGDETILDLPGGVSATVGGTSRTGEIVALAPGEEIGPRIHFDDATAQITTRLGRRGVRLFDHALRDAVADVGTFDASPAWRLAARFEPLPGQATEAYGFALESSPREVRVPGVVTFQLAGADHEVRPFLDDGSLLLVFADRTTGERTKPPSRFVLIDPPTPGAGEPGPVVVDFNRAFLPPCAFSEQFNCPLPPPGHRFEAAIEAGETWVAWAPGHTPAP